MEPVESSTKNISPVTETKTICLSDNIAVTLETRTTDQNHLEVFRKPKHLIEVCCEFIQKHINTSNYRSWFRLSTEFGLSQIKEKTMHVIYMNFEQMSKAEEFLMLTEKEIKSLLSYENPYTDFEEEVFKAVVAWVSYDKPNREHLTWDLLKMIRFQYLSTGFKADNNSIIADWRTYTSLETTYREDMFFKSRFGRLLFVDINIANTIAIIHMYDRKTDVWHKKIQIPFKEDIVGFSTLVINNKLFVVGGMDKDGHVRDDIECFDLYTLKWISRSHMHYNRRNCQLSELDGQLCICRGYGSHSEFINEIELYNPATGEIIELCRSYSPYSKMSTCKGVLYLIDLRAGILQLYYSRTQNWAQIRIQGLSVNDFFFMSLVADEKYLYFASEGVIRYDLNKKSWSGDCKVDFSQCTKAMILNNKIVISRNIDGSNTIIFEEYDPNTNTHRKLKNLLGIKSCTFLSCSIGSYNA